MDVSLPSRGHADMFCLQQAQPGVRGVQAPLYAHEVHVNAKLISNIKWLEEETKNCIFAICSENEILSEASKAATHCGLCTWSTSTIALVLG